MLSNYKFSYWKLSGLFILSFFVIGNTNVYSQNFKLKVSGGYYFYSLNSLKQSLIYLNEYNIEWNKIPSKITDNFPNYFMGEIGIEYDVSELYSIGFFFGYQETGGRIHYKDYSGEFSDKITLGRQTFGFDNSLNIPEFFEENTIVSFGISLIYVRFKFSEDQLLRLNGIEFSTNHSESTDNSYAGISPFFQIGYKFGFYNFSIRTGYDILIDLENFYKEGYWDYYSIHGYEYNGAKIAISCSLDLNHFFEQ